MFFFIHWYYFIVYIVLGYDSFADSHLYSIWSFCKHCCNEFLCIYPCAHKKLSKMMMSAFTINSMMCDFYIGQYLEEECPVYCRDKWNKPPFLQNLGLSKKKYQEALASMCYLHYSVSCPAFFIGQSATWFFILTGSRTLIVWIIFKLSKRQLDLRVSSVCCISIKFRAFLIPVTRTCILRKLTRNWHSVLVIAIAECACCL